ncbi:MAG: DNA polymerase III subunit gamma/tau [Gammaproteobacteria bacterium]|nr:DNA polymerase III subunit gamma/tau [Gammaproteobacteria bacterium]MCY4255310.1 DNA polymerase III subunit gamma/tau [Gammaproteobacteria bacterium]
MSYLVLARKWRPRKFSEVRGQPHAVRALSNAISAKKVHHAWLFAGTRGVGKTTLARILAAALNCEADAAPEPCGECGSCVSIQEGSFVDLMEVDAASRTKVEQTRELLENVQYAPTEGRCKIYLIDEAHMLSASSFNALLKTLEEPPPHVKFLLATTEPRRLPVTVLSRCLQINLRAMDSETIAGQLTAICKGEEVNAEPGALARIARAAGGSMRDALSLLDQAVAYGGDAVRETDVADMLGGADQPSIVHLLNAIAVGDGEALLGGARELRERLADPANILAELASALQRLALIQAVGASVVDEDDQPDTLAPLAEALPADQVQLLYEIAIQGRSTLPLAPDPGLGLEMTLLRMLAFQPDAAAKHVREGRKDAGGQGPVSAGGGLTRTGATEPVEEGAMPGSPPLSMEKQTLTADSWPETVRGLDLQGLPGEIAAHSELVQAKNECLHLRLDGQHENLLTDDALKELRVALIATLPAFREVEIEIAGAGQGGTLAGRDRETERRRQQRAEREFRADPFVQASLDIFGNDIEIGSIRPIDGGQSLPGQ